MKIFKNKFKAQVVYFAEGRYQVDYAYYRFIPVYRSLYFWFEQTLTGGTECWSIKLFNLKEAKNIASNLKRIEDVREWYKPYEEKKKDFYKRKEEYYNKKVPYKTKSF